MAKSKVMVFEVADLGDIASKLLFNKGGEIIVAKLATGADIVELVTPTKLEIVNSSQVHITVTSEDYPESDVPEQIPAKLMVA